MKDYKKILEGVVNIINTAEKSDIGFANICTGDAWFGYCLPYNEETAKLIGTTINMEV